jgi:hypothetical protein
MSRSRSAAHPIGVAAVAACVVVAAAATVFVLVVGAVVFVHRTVQTSPAGTDETVGGLHYDVEGAWILDPGRTMDAALAKGLPASDRRVRRDRLLYAVFVGVTNETGRSLPMAHDIALRDTRYREYAPLRLGAGNAYGYRPTVMAPQTHQPPPSSPAATNVSTEGAMLVFKLPRRAYDDGPLQLVVHDPAHPGSSTTIQVA